MRTSLEGISIRYLENELMKHIKNYETLQNASMAQTDDAKMSFYMINKILSELGLEYNTVNLTAFGYKRYAHYVKDGKLI